MKMHLHAATDLELTDLETPDLEVHGDADGEGFGALQMLGASLALCTAAVLAAYAEGVVKTHLRNARLRVRWEYADKPYRVGAMWLDIHWPELPENRIEAVRRAAETCTVHRTLEHAPEITTAVSR